MDVFAKQIGTDFVTLGSQTYGVFGTEFKTYLHKKGMETNLGLNSLHNAE
jgi:hypothetical protein